MSGDMIRPGPLFAQRADRSSDLFTLGDPCVDIYFATHQVPVAGEKRLGRMLGCFAGGTESNVACAASRLGLTVSVCGRVGDDVYAAMLLAEFSRFGVSTAQVTRMPGATSASALIMVPPDGEKALVYSPMTVPPAPVGDRLGLLEQSRAFYSAPYDLPRFLLQAEAAQGFGTDVIIDIEAAMAPDTETFHTLLGGADVVFMNRDSFSELTGLQPSIEALQGLLHRGPRLLIVTLGVEGAMAVSRTESCWHTGFPQIAVDSTGAGDCFAGAFLACSLRGGTLAESMSFACAAACFAVRDFGARSGYPRRADVESRLRSADLQQFPASVR
ncbi:carbohydrate kinase family protein [Pseudomonas gingeri]|uniref:Carbohydrate kinase family protein n=1 Tax=Pseudomonas gingeri TaxID=117681 RepID=A0A7Y8CLC3_9PSED|nr:carbohydrate kinase family protein [Pseudomonas gingeri]NWB27880.1 carbohydrate kinase family protein [Pseudomonas gingeri]NWC35403.1 carbohydrate kinase family protein [Pseudomonas gingeri]NWD04505.1 carbohydrate kinase family protein [Pseudomonas gingeri]NWE31128.1 carbohydrate kinase family protein [Pseudomonas gingeri]NWE59190.1 carbohydrate kinase family protein [Pseudomonas gingeri]